ncbi:pilus assembly protein N-terminal domain-containing protein [uncultured Bradyrhizobium sp.]|uniref:pilus assembly protein N-terminal domain-containing protein n=1 Tax=uncultured Bradyrhizobium sp. TaxID=199684 RepID=UPI0035CC2B80
MSVRSLRIALRAYFLFRSLAIGILLVPASAFAAGSGTPIPVHIDQAKLVRLPERAATIIVGNPLIADITLQPGGIIIVTGKSYGATNFVAMDRNGEVLVDRIIMVESAADPIVTVYRGVERESYSCMPICQPRITLGDSEKFLKGVLDQAGALSGQAAGAAASKPQ